MERIGVAAGLGDRLDLIAGTDEAVGGLLQAEAAAVRPWGDAIEALEQP